MNEPVIVIGEGWSALAASGWLGAQGVAVKWISGTGSHLLAPVPFLEASPGVQAWAHLAAALGIETGESRKGSFLREFRNKGFREPLWTQAPTPSDREDVLNESLWEPERRIASVFEEKFEQVSLMDLEESIRTQVLALPNVTRIEGASVIEIQWDQNQGTLQLGSGEKITFQKLIFADRLSSLKEIRGLPKTLLSSGIGSGAGFKTADFERKFKPYSALQLVLHHEPAVGVGIEEGFFLELIKDAGEEGQKHVFGGFFAGGRKSIWTAALSSDELEDNHLIAKRLRRIKQALNKVFSGPEWLSSGKKDFIGTVTSETVRLEESTLFSSGKSEQLPFAWENSGITFLTDGLGPAAALQQVSHVLGAIATQAGPVSEAEDVSIEGSSQR